MSSTVMCVCVSVLFSSFAPPKHKKKGNVLGADCDKQRRREEEELVDSF